MAIRLKLKGNKALLKGISKISKKVKENVSDEIEASIYKIHADASMSVPVDTGVLKNSITPQYDAFNLRGIVEVNAKYSPYVEFGTGGKVNIPKGLEEYARIFKGKGIKQVNLPPRPFLFPAAFRELPKLLQRINKGIGKDL